jgi:hypothetical protein
MPIFPNGLGATTGDALATGSPFYSSGTVYYVSSVLGDDTNSGLSRLDPKATLASAQTAGSAGDIVVLAADHTETLTAKLTISKALTIIGEGTASGVPTATFINNQAAANMMEITSDDVQFRNVKFPAETQSNSAVRITTAKDKITFKGCYFEINKFSTDSTIEFTTGASNIIIENTTFISTAVSGDATPLAALEISAATDGILLDGVTFDGGTIGFRAFALLASAAAMTNVRVENLSLLRGADVDFHASSTGYIMPTTTTGSARVNGIS